MLLAELVTTSAAVAATRSRLAKVAALAECLRRAGPDEIEIAVGYLSGELRQRRTGVGWAALRDLTAGGTAPGLELAEVDAAFARIEAATGAGSAAARREELAALFARATAEESRFLALLAGGELRQGALAGIVSDAVAAAAGVGPAAVRRAAMLAGDLPAVARAALTEGEAGLTRSSSSSADPCSRCSPRPLRRSRPRSRRRARPRSSGSSTACASRCTATATTSRSSRARSTPSASACPRSSRPCARCRCAR